MSGGEGPHSRVSSGSELSALGSPATVSPPSSLHMHLLHTSTTATTRTAHTDSDTEDVSEDESGSIRSATDMTPARRARAMLLGGGRDDKALRDEYDSCLLQGKTLLRQKQLKDAERCFNRAIRRATDMGDANSLDVGIAVNSLAEVYRKQKKLGEANRLYTQALSIYEHQKADAGEIATIVNNMAGLAGEQDRFDDAIAGYQRAMVLLEKRPMYVAMSLNNMGQVEKRRGRTEEALSLFHRALDMMDECEGESKEEWRRTKGRVLNNLAALYHKMGDLVRAEEKYQASLRLWRCLKTCDSAAIQALTHLASINVLRDRVDEAITYLEEAINLLRASSAGLGATAVPILSDMAELLHKQGRLGDAEKQYRMALALLSAASNPRHHEATAVILGSLAGLCRKVHKEDEAAMLYTRALKLAETHLPATHVVTVGLLKSGAELHASQGNYSAAADMYDRAIASAGTSLGPDHPHLHMLRAQLAAVTAAAAVSKNSFVLGVHENGDAAAGSTLRSGPEVDSGTKTLSMGVISARGLTSAVRSVGVVVEWQGKVFTTPYVSVDDPKWDFDMSISVAPAEWVGAGSTPSAIAVRVVGKRFVGQAKVLGSTNLYPHEVRQGLQEGQSQRWYLLWKVKGTSRKQSSCELCVAFRLV